MAGAATGPLVNVSEPWEALNSDLARQYYRRHLAGDSVPQRNYSTIPEPIQTRLKAAGTTFNVLPGLLQRALVWDSGYVENGNFDGSDGKAIPLVRVQTLNGISMADIAVSSSEYKTKTQCDVRTCHGYGYDWYKTEICPSTAALSVSTCLVDPFDDPGETEAAIWSIGGNDTMIPAMRLLRHAWDFNKSGVWNEVAAIHTSEKAIEPIFGRCAYNSADNGAIGSGSLVIPCETSTRNSTIGAEKKSMMRPPKQSEFVTKWLQQCAETASLTNALKAWNGETSDLARQFYRRHLAGDSVPPRNYLNIPDAIQLRLNATGTTFDTLPGLLQRAHVWDTGYVENGNFYGNDGKAIPLVRVLTLNVPLWQISL